MRLFDMTLSSPAANLACDEAVLNDSETHGGPGTLRFWESSVPFVVVGYGARVEGEVHLEACRAESVPVLKRCSGGGTVLQGPGCFNYAVVLPLNAVGPDATIPQTNRFVMERHRAAMAALLGQPVAIAGHTDLVLGDRKFSGNAQRRRKTWFLFHGTFLLNYDAGQMARLLLPPPRQPDYRRHRVHRDFLTSLPVTRQQLRAALASAWSATTSADDSAWRARLEPSIDRIARERSLISVNILA